MIRTVTMALAALALGTAAAAAQCAHAGLVTAQTEISVPAAPITTAQAPTTSTSVQQ